MKPLESEKIILRDQKSADVASSAQSATLSTESQQTLERSSVTQNQSGAAASRDRFPGDANSEEVPQPQRKARVRSARKVTPEPEVKSIWDDVLIEPSDKKSIQETKQAPDRATTMPIERLVSKSSLPRVPESQSAINSQFPSKPKTVVKPKAKADSVIERLFRSPPVKSVDTRSVPTYCKPDLKPMETHVEKDESQHDSAKIIQGINEASDAKTTRGVKSSPLDSSDEHNTSREWWPTTHEWISTDQSKLSASEVNKVRCGAGMNTSLEEMMKQMCSFKSIRQTQDKTRDSNSAGNRF